MNSTFSFRKGDNEALSAEFIHMLETDTLDLKYEKLENPIPLTENDILAVHFANGGAQGDSGAVVILCLLQNSIHIMYGNYMYEKLDLDDVIRVLPMLKCLDSRYSIEPPYPFGGEISVPEGWNYMYMGAMNHLFVKKKIFEEAESFIEFVVRKTGAWEAFNAIAWYCGA